MSSAPSSHFLFWEIVELAKGKGARTVHLGAGQPPLMRLPGEDLHPVAGELSPLSAEVIDRELSRLVEPEHWDRLEATGHGEVLANSALGQSVRLAVLRGVRGWAVVAHL